MKFKLDFSDPFIKKKAQSVQFLDIETSLINARVYSPGQQFVAAHQTSSYTTLLSVAGGTMYDLMTKGEKGVWSFANHHDKKAFAKDPLDDTFVLRRIWDICDKAEVIIAHNAKFDESWILGRFLQKGWPLPSKFSVVCSYQGLSQFAFASKKLDQLSKQLNNTKKISTSFSLWDRCSNGDIKAFKQMEKYNRGDIYDTLFKVYTRTCMYYPDYAVDFSDPTSEIPQCKVDGSELEWLDDYYISRSNGCEYQLYYNPVYNITYRDRFNVDSTKAYKGFIRTL